MNRYQRLLLAGSLGAAVSLWAIVGCSSQPQQPVPIPTATPTVAPTPVQLACPGCATPETMPTPPPTFQLKIQPGSQGDNAEGVTP